MQIICRFLEKHVAALGKMRSLEYAKVVGWISEAWLELEVKMKASSFQRCGITSRYFDEYSHQLRDFRDFIVFNEWAWQSQSFQDFESPVDENEQ